MGKFQVPKCTLPPHQAPDGVTLLKLAFKNSSDSVELLPACRIPRTPSSSIFSEELFIHSRLLISQKSRDANQHKRLITPVLREVRGRGGDVKSTPKAPPTFRPREPVVRYSKRDKEARMQQLLDETTKCMDVIGKRLKLSRTVEADAVEKSTRGGAGESDKGTANGGVTDSNVPEFQIDSTNLAAEGVDLSKAGAITAEGQDGGEREGAAVPEFLQAREVYYALAHSQTVALTEQPSNLVGVRLTEHQMVGLRWLWSLHHNRLNGILADEMGLGKTLQTIALLAQLRAPSSSSADGVSGGGSSSRSKRRRSLVVAPLSVLAHWANEFATKLPSMRIAEVRGSAAEREELYARNKGADVLLVQYDTVIRDVAALQALAPFDYVIVDEAHRLKNPQCRLAQCLRRIDAAHRLLLTGTPLSNHVEELWALLNFLLPGVFDEGFSFGDWFKKRDSEAVDWTVEERALIINRLHSVLRPFFLRRTKAVLAATLPPKSEVTICCAVSALQRHLLGVVSGATKVTIDSPLRRLARATNPVIEARKICNHPFLVYDDPEAVFGGRSRDGEDGGEAGGGAVAIASAKDVARCSSQLSKSARRRPLVVSLGGQAYTYEEALLALSGKVRVFDTAVQLLNRCGHKVLVFSQFTSTLDVLEEVLEMRGISYVRLDGASSLEERDGACDEFRGGDIGVFLLSTRAGGLGLNLQTADTVIMFDSDYNPQQDLQAKARAYRLGQKKHVMVVTLVADCVLEQRILEVAHTKLQQERRIIGEGRFDGETVTKSERDRISASLLESLRSGEGQGGGHRSMAVTERLEELPGLLGRDASDVKALQAAARELGGDPHATMGVGTPGSAPRSKRTGGSGRKAAGSTRSTSCGSASASGTHSRCPLALTLAGFDAETDAALLCVRADNPAARGGDPLAAWEAECDADVAAVLQQHYDVPMSSKKQEAEGSDGSGDESSSESDSDSNSGESGTGD